MLSVIQSVHAAPASVETPRPPVAAAIIIRDADLPAALIALALVGLVWLLARAATRRWPDLSPVHAFAGATLGGLAGALAAGALALALDDARLVRFSPAGVIGALMAGALAVGLAGAVLASRWAGRGAASARSPGLKRAGATIARGEDSQSAPASPLEDFEPAAAARAAILRGEAPPAHWRPSIRALSFEARRGSSI